MHITWLAVPASSLSPSAPKDAYAQAASCGTACAALFNAMLSEVGQMPEGERSFLYSTCMWHPEQEKSEMERRRVASRGRDGEWLLRGHGVSYFPGKAREAVDTGGGGITIIWTYIMPPLNTQVKHVEIQVMRWGCIL